MRGLFIYLHLESKAGKQGKKGRIRQIKDEEKVKRSNICTQGGEVPGKRLPEKYINTGVWQTGQILGGGGIWFTVLYICTVYISSVYPCSHLEELVASPDEMLL
jgi:hypothetical protein